MPVRQADVAGRAPKAGIVLLALAAFGALGLPATAAEKHQSPLTTIMNTHLYADPGRVPDFVERSRPSGGTGYIPLRVPEAERRAKPKTAAELKAMEIDLEAAGAVNRRRAGQATQHQAAPDIAAKKSGKVSTVRSSSAAPIH